MLKWLKQKPMHGLGIVTAEKITDDPLATIQVNNQKKSKNKSNEIYAVSRVNPLFEEEDSKGTFSPGNNSGSSGYDSGPSDDDTSASASPKLHLFRDKDDDLIHHETAIIGASGRPILQILEKNPNYVKSISVAVSTRRPLSPIAEQTSSAQGGDSSSARSKSSSPSGQAMLKVSAIPVPKRDAVGVAKVLQKDSRYVQSIRIGPATKGGRLTANSNHGPPVTRKHSVTFAEKVDVVDGKAPSSRKSSVDQDSIVTESLLMMTSKDSRRLSDYANVNRRLSSASGKSVGGDDGKEPKPDLQAFSSSIRKNRPIKQMPSNGRSPDRGGGGDGEMKETADDGESAEDHDNDERSSSASSQRESPRRPRSVVSGKSPFGGIADHYAAAKEIAKEIESYSNGSKNSTKRSLVRDLLLSSRGRHYNQQTTQRGDDNRIQNESSSSQHNGAYQHPSHAHLAYNYNMGIVDGEFRPQRTMLKKKEPWELVRVQQVYVKPNVNSPLAQQHHRPHSSEGQVHNIQSNSQQYEYHDYDHFYRRLSDPSEGSSGASSGASDGGPPTPDRVPIYDALPGSSRLGEDSDSGNSTDRSPKEVRLEIDKGKDGESRLLMSTTAATVHKERGDTDISSTGSSSAEASPKNITRKVAAMSSSSLDKTLVDRDAITSAASVNGSKVMIVTGDSQNVVVDLSGIPEELRDAIISGTALITLPEGLSGLLKPGYTMINIPSTTDLSGSEHIYVNHSSGSESESNSSSSPINNTSKVRNNRDTNSSSQNAIVVDMGTTSASVSVNGLLEYTKYAAKNKAQVWDVLQQHSVHGASLSPGKPYRDNKKRITTVLPFHPNQDSNTSPDFTIEGHRMDKQMRKVKVGKKRRCVCRVCGMLFFLVAFLGVLVALSMIYTRGQKYFGSYTHNNT